MAETVGIEPTSLLQRHFSKVVTYQLAYPSVAEATGVEPARLPSWIVRSFPTRWAYQCPTPLRFLFINKFYSFFGILF